ncbi:MAG: squalene/phytoene synthase family protein [Burkholderiales bacterium]|nr:squalene/phytoene synthase family protein [Burkholderiales bacterium]
MLQSANHSITTPRPGSSLYYAVRAAPDRTRPTLQTWLQWWHEVSAIPLTINDPGVAHAKLTWWQQEVQRGFEGQAQHPLMKQLMTPGFTARPSQLPPQVLWMEQIGGLQGLIQQTRWLDEVSQRRHALSTTGAACESAAWLLGADTEAATSAARELGWGLRQAHHLARLGQDARLGWLHVPVSVLQQHDVKAHELLRPDPQHPPLHWPALLAYLHGQAHSSLQSSCAAIAALPAAERQALRPLLVLARLNMSLIDAIANAGPGVLQQRIILTPLRKWWGATVVRWGTLR